jgi:hypothetical protein
MKNGLKLFLVLLLSVTTFTTINGQNRKERKILYNSQYNYEIEARGVGQDGTKIFKIWGYGSTVAEAVISAKANAVAACIFKGLTGGAGAAPTPPICTEASIEVTKSDYFEKFFELGGKYLQYVAVTNDGNPAGEDRLKIKKGYKVAIYVQVMYDALRRQLEADGIARRLDAGF